MTNATSQPSSDKNQHIRDFLSRYIDLPYSPHYAVLLAGPWGVGKTYLVKEFLRKKFGDDADQTGKRYIYVSLYGLASVDELDAALFQAAYPLLASQAIQVGGRVGMAIFKSISKITRVDLPDFKFSDLPKPKAELYVFDDLERCEMPINMSLGYINEFVEHEGHKVVIVANEMEIRGEEKVAYTRRREKLIGKTFEVQSVVDEPFQSFIELIGDPLAKALVNQKRADISDVYHQSGLCNLRILQQSLWDFSCFFGALTERHLKSDEAVTSLLRSFFALSFEFKAGRLRQEDLKEWFSSSMEYYVLKHDRDKEAGRELSHGEQAIERYGGDIDLSGTFLSKKLVEDVFVKGIINYLERYESISTQAPISLIRKLNLHGVLFGTPPSEQRRSSRKLTIKWNNNFERETLFIQVSCCKFSDYACYSQK
jgi:DNA polymerase III delta prime subunit